MHHQRMARWGAPWRPRCGCTSDSSPSLSWRSSRSPSPERARAATRVPASTSRDSSGTTGRGSTTTRWEGCRTPVRPVRSSAGTSERRGQRPTRSTRSTRSCCWASVRAPSGLSSVRGRDRVAAATAWSLARRFTSDPTAPVLSLWIVGVSTPLLFDSGLILAHTLAAAAVGVAAMLAFRAAGPGRIRWWASGGLVRSGDGRVDAPDRGGPRDRGLRAGHRRPGSLEADTSRVSGGRRGAVVAVAARPPPAPCDRRGPPADAAQHWGRWAARDGGTAST